MKPNYLWVLEIKENSRWWATIYVAISRSDMAYVKRNFLSNNSNAAVRVKKYEAKS